MEPVLVSRDGARHDRLSADDAGRFSEFWKCVDDAQLEKRKPAFKGS